LYSRQTGITVKECTIPIKIYTEPLMFYRSSACYNHLMNDDNLADMIIWIYLGFWHPYSYKKTGTDGRLQFTSNGSADVLYNVENKIARTTNDTVWITQCLSKRFGMSSHEPFCRFMAAHSESFWQALYYIEGLWWIINRRVIYFRNLLWQLGEEQVKKKKRIDRKKMV
jgi:hypothetical protein